MALQTIDAGTDTHIARGQVAARVIPCLDCRDGRVVKGVRFQGLRDAGDPVALAEAYAQQGADELVVLDVSATDSGHGHRLQTVRAVRKVLPIPLTVGGGVRTLEDAAALLDAGADKVGINTAAVRDPSLLSRVADKYGRQCVVLAVDAAQKTPANPSDAKAWEVKVRSGKEKAGLDALAWVLEGQKRGAGEILLTSWDRDGTRSGYDLEMLTAVCGALRIPVIASGGAANAVHLAEALRAGASGVLAASIFHDCDLGVAEVKEQLAELLRQDGIEVRQ